MSRRSPRGAAVPLCCAALRAFDACHGADEVLARLRELLAEATLAERSALARARVARPPEDRDELCEALVRLALARTGVVSTGGADAEAVQRLLFVFSAAATRLGHVRLRPQQAAAPASAEGGRAAAA